MAQTDRYSKVSMNTRGALKDAWNRFITNWQDVEMYQSNIKQSDRQVSRGDLANLLEGNACEIVFVRRRPERAPGRPEIRRMLCSNSMNLLNSMNGIRSLNFHLPGGPKKIDEIKHNVVVVWDIFEQDYRNVSMDTCYLRQTVPGDDTFWRYYSDVLLKLTPQQKRNFEDSIA